MVGKPAATVMISSPLLILRSPRSGEVSAINAIRFAEDPELTREQYLTRKVLGHMEPEEKMNIYKKLLKEIDDPESLRDIKRNIDARLKVLANQ